MSFVPTPDLTVDIYTGGSTFISMPEFASVIHTYYV